MDQRRKQSDDDVLEQVVVREVAGVFHSVEGLDKAIMALETAGFDRADIDVMGDAAAIYERLGTVYAPVEERPDIPGMPRRAFIGRDDVVSVTAAVGGTLFAIGALTASAAVVASGGGVAVALLAAAAAGSVTGGLGAALAQVLGREQARAIDLQLSAGGIVLWVRVRTEEQQRKAEAILRDAGAEAVRTHDIRLERRLADLPLARFNPDPWLGPEHNEPN